MTEQRGQLSYEITTSSEQLEAGKEFSISVEITNPYNVPVSINSVSTRLPIEFVDLARERLKEKTGSKRRRGLPSKLQVAEHPAKAVF